MRPGDPIGHRSATRGLKVQGIDQGGVWYNATVKEVAADNSRVLLTFTGFGASHNRWHTLKDKTVRARLPADKLRKETELRVWGKVVGRQADGTWQVSSIIGKRRSSASTVQPGLWFQMQRPQIPIEWMHEPMP